MVASYITTAKKPRTITIHKSKQIPLSDNNVTIKLTCTSEKKSKSPPKAIIKIKPFTSPNLLHHSLPPAKKKVADTVPVLGVARHCFSIGGLRHGNSKNAAAASCSKERGRKFEETENIKISRWVSFIDII